MSKVTTKVNNKTVVDVAPESDVIKISLDPVNKLEEAAKVGFYCEARQKDDSMLEPLVRLCCESKDGDSAPTILTPWCTVSTLSTMVQGCLYLQPLLIATIKDRQKNAEEPTPEKA